MRSKNTFFRLIGVNDMKRKIMNCLIKWKNKKYRKLLILRSF